MSIVWIYVMSCVPPVYWQSCVPNTITLDITCKLFYRLFFTLATLRDTMDFYH